MTASPECRRNVRGPSTQCNSVARTWVAKGLLVRALLLSFPFLHFLVLCDCNSFPIVLWNFGSNEVHCITPVILNIEAFLTQKVFCPLAFTFPLSHQYFYLLSYWGCCSELTCGFSALLSIVFTAHWCVNSLYTCATNYFITCFVVPKKG